MNGGKKTAILLNSFMILLSFITALILLYVLVVTLINQGKKEVIIPCMLLNLVFSCLSLLAFFALEINEGFYEGKNIFEFPLTTYECTFWTSLWLPAIFLSMAVILNINKWIYFTWKILQ